MHTQTTLGKLEQLRCKKECNGEETGSAGSVEKWRTAAGTPTFKFFFYLKLIELNCVRTYMSSIWGLF